MLYNIKAKNENVNSTHSRTSKTDFRKTMNTTLCDYIILYLCVNPESVNFNKAVDVDQKLLNYLL